MNHDIVKPGTSDVENLQFEFTPDLIGQIITVETTAETDHDSASLTLTGRLNAYLITDDQTKFRLDGSPTWETSRSGKANTWTGNRLNSSIRRHVPVHHRATESYRP